MRPRVLGALLAAVILNALGWVLPVLRGYRGWQAFRVALSPLVPYRRFPVPSAYLAVLAASSALTNALFCAVALALAFRASGSSLARASFWALCAATVLNLHWPISVGDSRAELALGYYLWVASFAVLAVAAWLESRSKPDADLT